MDLPTDGWENKAGTSRRSTCKCGSWKQHWINFSEEEWPDNCVVSGCYNSAEHGAHVINLAVSGKEYIIPACETCNNRSDAFSIKGGITLVSANRAETCGQ